MAEINRIGLVLEGGGMRGIYTAGVLDYFMEKNLYFPYTIGVSAGACNGASYVSRQKERSKRININYIRDKRYLSYRNLIKEKSIFGIDFAYNQIPNKLEPFDNETFFESKDEFIIGTTDCMTGKPVYYGRSQYNEDRDNFITLVRASSSLPFVAPIVKYRSSFLLDGGMSDPIPVKKSISDGNDKNIIVLTRNIDYRKEPFKLKWLARKAYSKYPGISEAMEKRHIIYNETLDYIEKLEKDNKAIVIRPSAPINVGRLEKNQERLRELYEMGYTDGKEKYEEIMKFAGEAISLVES